jgi:hypothetical protein
MQDQSPGGIASGAFSLHGKQQRDRHRFGQQRDVALEQK